MSGYRHTIMLDEFNYYYVESPKRITFSNELYYSKIVNSRLSPYNQLFKLSDTPTRALATAVDE